MPPWRGSGLSISKALQQSRHLGSERAARRRAGEALGVAEVGRWLTPDKNWNI